MIGAGWWLRLQLGLALAGGVTWLGGAFSESDFLAGLGAGLLIAALTLRFGRRDSGHPPAEPGAPGHPPAEPGTRKPGADPGRDEAEDA